MKDQDLFIPLEKQCEVIEKGPPGKERVYLYRNNCLVMCLGARKEANLFAQWIVKEVTR